MCRRLAGQWGGRAGHKGYLWRRGREPASSEGMAEETSELRKPKLAVRMWRMYPLMGSTTEANKTNYAKDWLVDELFFIPGLVSSG